MLSRYGGELDIYDVAVRPPSRGELLARLEMAGVCGSDVHSWRGDVPRSLPMPLGHEGVGTILSLGEGLVTDSAGAAIGPGDRIYWVPLRPCRHCYYCTVQEDLTSCENATIYGPAGELNWSSYADYVMLPPGLAFYRVPTDTPTEAVMAFGCAMPTVLQAVDRLGGLRISDNVVIQGSGPVGLAATLVAVLCGVRTIAVLDRVQARLDLARRLGATATYVVTADTESDACVEWAKHACGGRGGDVVIEATGALPAFAQGLRMVARNGRYLLVGLWAGDGATAINPYQLLRQNVRIIGSAYAAPTHYYRSLQIAERAHGTWPMADVVTGRFGLDRATDAFAAVERGDPGKAVLLP